MSDSESYRVKVGLNLGVTRSSRRGKRFEAGSTISGDQLESLTTERARSWLLENEYIEPISTSARKKTATRKKTTSSATASSTEETS